MKLIDYWADKWTMEGYDISIIQLCLNTDLFKNL